MKNNKWIRVTLTILLTLIVLVGVAGVGFRMGVMQSTTLARTANGAASRMPFFGHMQDYDNNFNNRPGEAPGGDPRMMQGFDQRGGPGKIQGFSHGGFERGGRGGFFSPLFGLIRLAVLGALLWFGYKFVKNSGWRITRVTPSPVPTASETPRVDVEEKKESE